MLAIVDDMEAWTARGVEIAAASDDPGVRYWLGPLYNNVGWSRLDAGDTAGALDAFELALASRERDDPRPEALAFARYGVGKALRAAGRADEAVAMLELCLAGRRRLPRRARRGLCRGRSARRSTRAGRARARAHSRDGDATRIARLRELAAAAGRPAD